MKNLRSYICVFLLFMATKNNAQEFEVTVTGKGKPVLLFPGFACTAEVYKGIVNELSSHYEVHSFTFAGFGKVPPITFPWLPKIKDALQVYIQKNHINKPVIIGHSLGGVLGLWLTAEEPKAYSKLIVIDALPATGAIMMPNYKSENITYENPHNKKIIEMNTRDFTNMAKQMVQSMSLNKEVHQQLTDWMVMSDRSTFVYGYTDFLKLDLRDKLADITIPVSIYAATYPFGMEVKQTNYKTQYANLKNYTLNFAENSGHFIMYDKPEWFLKQIKSELSIK